MNERLILLRKHYDLTQTEIGDRLGMSRSAIANLELGRVEFTEVTIRHICNTLNVNQVWFRTGDGEMFVDGGGDFVAELAAKYQLNDFQQSLVRAVYEMPPELQDMVMEVARKLVSEAAAPPEPVETDYERTTRIVNERLDALEDEQAAAATDKRA